MPIVDCHAANAPRLQRLLATTMDAARGSLIHSYLAPVQGTDGWMGDKGDHTLTTSSSRAVGGLPGQKERHGLMSKSFSSLSCVTLTVVSWAEAGPWPSPESVEEGASREGGKMKA